MMKIQRRILFFRRISTLLLALRLLLLVVVFPLVIRSTPIPCNTTSECAIKVGYDSTCIPKHNNDESKSNKICSNPFYQYGCLNKMLPMSMSTDAGKTTPRQRIRVCNSNDPLPESVEQGYCRPSEFDYIEIRILSQNWESVFFEAWILQIVLSEILGVPTTIETGSHNTEIDFYDLHSRFQYGTSYDWESLVTSRNISNGDCRLVNNNNNNDDDPDKYVSCSHFIPEVWLQSGHLGEVQMYTEKGVIENAQGIGALGFNGWHIPKFTARRHPTLLSSFGLQGEENRRFLAETFLRPTTWKDYCDLVSTNNCTTGDDGIAARAPTVNSTEEDRMFVDGLYTGHFRKTDKNDCDQYPTACTGHIADYPCGWGSMLLPQTHYLGIALESNGPEASGGYSYSQLVEIWKAANATKSDVAMVWWTPENLYQSFLGNDAEFTRITLPTATQTCEESRIKAADRCSDNMTVRLGNPLGACDEVPHVLRKVTGTSLYDAIYHPSIPEAMRSPGYEVLELFDISALQIGELFDYWHRHRTPREAVCQWVVDHMEFVQTLVPRTYPRVLRAGDERGPLQLSSLVLSCIATLVVLLSGGMVYKQRKRRVMVVSQVEFLWLLLAGLLLISTGAFVVAVRPTDASCVAGVWLVNVGYTLELVPLIVKVAAIHRLMVAARRMRRVKLSRRSLFGGVVLLMAIVVVFLILWTTLDPPHREAEYDLTDNPTEDDAIVVTVLHYCSSDSRVWTFLALAWNTLLLFCATVLAFQTRKLRQDFNETQTLAMMIYSHFFFVVLRFIVYFLSSVMSNAAVNSYMSLIYSVDTIATISIYFVPKFITPDRGRRSTRFLGFQTSVLPPPSYAPGITTGATHGTGVVATNGCRLGAHQEDNGETTNQTTNQSGSHKEGSDNLLVEGATRSIIGPSSSIRLTCGGLCFCDGACRQIDRSGLAAGEEETHLLGAGGSARKSHGTKDCVRFRKRRKSF